MPDFLPKTSATEAEAGGFKNSGSGRSLRRQVNSWAFNLESNDINRASDVNFKFSKKVS